MGSIFSGPSNNNDALHNEMEQMKKTMSKLNEKIEQMVQMKKEFGEIKEASNKIQIDHATIIKEHSYMMDSYKISQNEHTHIIKMQGELLQQVSKIKADNYHGSYFLISIGIFLAVMFVLRGCWAISNRVKRILKDDNQPLLA